jgi:uncharacterized membrane protein
MKLAILAVVIWLAGMFVAASILEEKGIEPDRPGHEIDCVEKKTC